ncbi:MAG: NUDIX domain-containing protein [Anaerohalosphaeraceae bacterium]
MATHYTITKLTQQPWLNLFDVAYSTQDGSPHHWLMCSRKDRPVEEAAVPDAVVIVPILPTTEGNRLVLTKEFRVPIDDGEFAFPAGLIDANETIESTVRRELKEETGLDVVTIHHVSPPVYSSAGLSDESCCMVLVTAAGKPSTHLNESHEQIEVLLYDIGDIRELLKSNKKIAAKAWGLLYHFAATGRIEFSAFIETNQEP